MKMTTWPRTGIEREKELINWFVLPFLILVSKFEMFFLCSLFSVLCLFCYG